ncbi:MAG TPA: polyphosphate kinase 2 family protein [Blastocatellia bacterium]|nr:polyphosphate kinase 2 family protein [Blastocatellia bacterium]
MKVRVAVAEEISKLIVPPGSKISLAKDYDPAHKAEFVKKDEADNLLQEGLAELVEMQGKLYAQDTYSVLVIFQAMDAAGKDGTIKHVMSGLNPQGCQVYSFKAPSDEELDHDYLWRSFKALPERGRIGIFNRSYYEEALVVRVHPEILARQRIPADTRDEGIWKRRFSEINVFEKYLVANGVAVIKFFLNVSKEEQKKRFLERIDEADKNWKFSVGDVKERARWDDYMQAYEDVFNNTSTEWAPWHIIPADRKWFTRLAVGWVILEKLRSLNLNYPTVSEEHKQELLKAREILLSEK